MADEPTADVELAMHLDIRDDHGCFGCGRLNPHGLRLRFFREPNRDGVWTRFTPQVEHEGFGGVAHGGVVTAVLDEVMAWAVYARGVWAMTGKIEVRFRKPVAIGVPTRAHARVVADRRRVLDTASDLRREADGVLLAEATATFVPVPEEQARAWRDRYVGRVTPGVSEDLA